ncbi:ring-1,2-phenylacetyl-CoA epoxidase subunit PaaE [Catalinimonas alkaloidigena]|uniref:Ring-1,2-phenylacetyl-CoA epoxidase subunit PaaE n=1 Tax=Catalinimonas alkaloidigena TaxID=1075417 RepID=A0A1G9HAE8_9BACT|nr:1,2-phenylacetyl-CoA epoxidase subunit PaaE [Catalinimonas alkaloidigena]SDL09900.1 ring-1,2-phenylacetyl-CoA epoxidase subunit PaaE [Catalinimonas alkaloidigena]
MSRFYPLTIKHIARETPDCLSLTLDVPPAWRDRFRFTQGQYLTFRRQVQGEELRRSYSLCSSPLDGEWKVAIKRVPQGRFSGEVVDSLQVGETLDVLPPQGKFYTPLQPERARHYVAFAAGSGITPVFSILKTLLQAEPHSDVTLVYGNRGRNTIIFKEAIEGLKNKFLTRFRVYHILSREQGEIDLFNGRIDKEKTRQLLTTLIDPTCVDEWFLCGPEAMIHDVRAELSARGIPPARVHFELFTTSRAATPSARRPAVTPHPDDAKRRVECHLDGRVVQLDLSYYGDTILEAALARGIDLPYSCKGGMCSTCRAKVLAGQVEMDVNYALDAEEVAAGYVLTCQARPLTEKVVLDYDQ